MQFEINKKQKQPNIKYMNIPVMINQSWNILSSIPFTTYYYFYPNSGWPHGDIIPVIIQFDRTDGNVLYYAYQNKIHKINTSYEFVVFDNIHECIIYALKYWKHYYTNIQSINITHTKIECTINTNKSNKLLNFINNELTNLQKNENYQLKNNFIRL